MIFQFNPYIIVAMQGEDVQKPDEAVIKSSEGSPFMLNVNESTPPLPQDETPSPSTGVPLPPESPQES